MSNSTTDDLEAFLPALRFQKVPDVLDPRVMPWVIQACQQEGLSQPEPFRTPPESEATAEPDARDGLAARVWTGYLGAVGVLALAALSPHAPHELALAARVLLIFAIPAYFACRSSLREALVGYVPPQTRQAVLRGRLKTNAWTEAEDDYRVSVALWFAHLSWAQRQWVREQEQAELEGLTDKIARAARANARRDEADQRQRTLSALETIARGNPSEIFEIRDRVGAYQGQFRRR